MRCLLEKEYLYTIVQEKLPPELFLKFKQNFERNVLNYNNEYELLSLIRRVIRRSIGKLAEDDVFEIGISVFDTFLKENVADKSSILLNMAFLHEGLNNTEKTDDCLRNALSFSLDKEFTILKVGNFFCQTAEKGIANPIERVKAVFQFSYANKNYTDLINNQIENTELTYQFYQQFKEFTGNTHRNLISKILKDKQTALSELENFLDRMKVLAEVYKITVDTYFLGQLVQKALGISKNNFIKQKEHKFTNKCVILEIKCLEIFISKNINDYYNYFTIACILRSAKEYKLHSYSDNNDKLYYDNHKMYVDKAIELGRNTLENQDKNNVNLQKTCRDVINAYLLRGNLGLKIALEDYRRAVELAFNAGNSISPLNLLDSISRFFIEKYDSTKDVSFLFIGFAVLKTLVHRNTIVEDDIMTHVANFYKCHKPNPIENFKNILSTRDLETSHNQIKTLSNSESKAITLKILKGKWKNLLYLQYILGRLKKPVDIYYKAFLNKMVVPAFKNAGQTFLEQNMHYLSSKCLLLESKCTKISSASKDIDDKLHSGLNIDYLRGDHEIELALDDYRQASDLSRDFLNIPDAPSLFDYICRFFMKEFDSNCKILNDLADYSIYLGLTDKATGIMSKIRPVDEDSRRISYNQLRDLIGNDPESFTSKILKGKSEILSGLQNLLEETKELVEDSRFKIDLDYLDKVATFAIHNTAQKFREQEDYECFHKCLILEIKCNEIFIAAKGYRDFTRFVNFHAIANILNTARKQYFSSFPEAEKYYKEYEIYLEKAIELGVKAIDKIDRLDNNFPKFFSSLADAYRLRGDLNVIEDERSSFKDYQKSVKLLEFMEDIIYEDDYLDWTVERLAQSYFRIKEYEKALEAYKILFEKSKTKTYQAALGIGNVYDAMGNFTEARNYYLECLWISKEDPAAYDKLMNLHRNYGNYDEAIKWQQRMNDLKCVCSSKKSLDYGYFIIGILYEEKGEESKAIDAFRDIVTEREPNSLIALDHLITLLISINEYREAIKWLERMMTVSTNSNWGYCRLGDCYLALKQDSEALEYYKKSLSIDPKFIPSLQRLAKWYESKRQYGKSIEIVNKIIDLVDNENSHGWYKWLGDLYLKLKDGVNALNAYNKSLEISPRQYEIYDRIEKITKKNKDVPSLYQKITELETQYNYSSNAPELATQIVNLCLSSNQKEYAEKIQKYLVFSIYKPDSIDYSERLALAYEMEEQYDLAIKERQKINGFESCKPEMKIGNLRKMAQLIKEKRLYNYRDIENLCTNEIEGFVKKSILTVEESEMGITSENDMNMSKIENNIYIFKEEILYLSKHYLDNGYFEKAHKFIQILLGSGKSELQNDKLFLDTKAKILKAEKKWKDAQKVVNKIIELYGKTARNLFSLGDIHRNKKEFSQAVICFKKAYAQDKHPASRDQVGATYREWAKEEGLSEQEKSDFKKVAIDWYIAFQKDYPEDRIIPYGLAKSYLLEPLKREDVDKGVTILADMLSKDIDREVIKELLCLWSKNINDTIKEIILNNYKSDVSGSRHSLLLCEIVKISKESNIFTPDVVSTFQGVFAETHDVNIRNSICKYFMKYMIYTCYQTADLKIIQKAIKEPIEIILGVEDQEESHRYLTECLGAEKGAYLEFLVEIIQPDIKKIEELVRALNEDNYSDFANQIRQEIVSIKERLKSIKFVSFDEGLVDIKKEIEHRHERYSFLAGRDMELLFKLNVKDNCYSKAVWDEIDSLIFDILDVAKDSYFFGSCKLTITSNDQCDFLLVSAEFCNSQQEGWSVIVSTIKEKLANRGTNASFIKKHDSFVAEKNFRIGEGEISTPFRKLFDFIRTTYAAPNNANYWKDIYGLAKEEIRLDSFNIQEEIENLLLLQISILFSRAKDLIYIFLNEPHDLHHLCTPNLPLEDRLRRINRVKESTKQISFFTKGFFAKKTKEKFPIRKAILRIIREFENIPVFDNMQVKTLFEEKANDKFNFVGSPEDIDMIIRNLFYNAFGALKKRKNLSGRFNPVIKISIDKKDREYEILFCDNGIGIPEDKKVRDLIIDFSQEPENDEKSKSGIGLYIISTLVNCYQGDFDIESSRTGDNSGTTFFVRLPFKFS